MTIANLDQSTAQPSNIAASPQQATESKACCGGPAETDPSACCVRDEAAKRNGKAGCGCTAAPEKIHTPARCCS